MLGIALLHIQEFQYGQQPRNSGSREHRVRHLSDTRQYIRALLPVARAAQVQIPRLRQLLYSLCDSGGACGVYSLHGNRRAATGGFQGGRKADIVYQVAINTTPQRLSLRLA